MPDIAHCHTDMLGKCSAFYLLGNNLAGCLLKRNRFWHTFCLINVCLIFNRIP
jgi:hypothetical protein